MGAQLVKKKWLLKLMIPLGDGTTTATVLAHASIAEGLRNVTAGANPMVVKHGIEQASKLVVEESARIAKKMSTKEEIAQVATISVSEDENVGNLIAETMDAVGNDGVVTVEESINGLEKRGC